MRELNLINKITINEATSFNDKFMQSFNKADESNKVTLVKLYFNSNYSLSRDIDDDTASILTVLIKDRGLNNIKELLDYVKKTHNVPYAIVKVYSEFTDLFNNRYSKFVKDSDFWDVTKQSTDRMLSILNAYNKALSSNPESDVNKVFFKSDKVKSFNEIKQGLVSLKGVSDTSTSKTKGSTGRLDGDSLNDIIFKANSNSSGIMSLTSDELGSLIKSAMTKSTDSKAFTRELNSAIAVVINKAFGSNVLNTK